ncbi:MAG: TolC family protein [Chryseobacterium sp.]|nr:MAG: TolC family protein [Chryseobacterium sp.]
MKKTAISILLCAGLAFSVQSCKVTDNYTAPVLPAQAQAVNGGETAGEQPLVPWREFFSDPLLQRTIDQVLADNYDFKIAVERITEADAYFRQSQLQYLPSLDAGATARFGRNNPTPGNSQSYQLALNTGWEIDIWGRLASAERAAYASLLQTEAVKRAVQTQLVAQTATYYFRLLALDRQLEITNATAALRREDIETMKLLKDAGIVTGAAVVQSEAQYYSAKVSIPDIVQRIRETENALMMLMGRQPGKIERNTLAEQNLNMVLSDGIAADVLRNRPDVQAAEQNFRVAFENTNVAKANLYPALNLGGMLGKGAANLRNFFDNSLLYTVNASLTQNIFSRGAKKAQIKINESRRRQAYYQFVQTVLQAASEVNNANNLFAASREKEGYRARQISSLEKAVEYNKELLKYTSNTTYTDVLTSEQNLLSAQLAGVNDRLEQLLALTDFYRSLGGGQF